MPGECGDEPRPRRDRRQSMREALSVGIGRRLGHVRTSIRYGDRGRLPLRRGVHYAAAQDNVGASGTGDGCEHAHLLDEHESNTPRLSSETTEP